MGLIFGPILRWLADWSRGHVEPRHPRLTATYDAVGRVFAWGLLVFAAFCAFVLIPIGFYTWLVG